MLLPYHDARSESSGPSIFWRSAQRCVGSHLAVRDEIVQGAEDVLQSLQAIREPSKLPPIRARIEAFEESDRISKFLELDAQVVSFESGHFLQTTPNLLHLPRATAEEVTDIIPNRYVRFVFAADSSALEPPPGHPTVDPDTAPFPAPCARAGKPFHAGPRIPSLPRVRHAAARRYGATDEFSLR
jgi:hypothetical protein